MLLRVVVPYTDLHPGASSLLQEHAPDHEPVPLDVEDTAAYWRCLSREWGRPGDLAVVEHDIGIHAEVMPQFESCPHLWCGFTYSINGQYLAALGCTRFRRALKVDVPDLFEAVTDLAWDGSPLPGTDWRRLDIRLAAVLTRRGHKMHLHGPPVEHYHVYPEV